jgi:hypothetical protein
MDTEQLFREAFWPHYPAEARANLAEARATDANPGDNPEYPARMAAFAETFVRGAAALDPSLASLGFDDASVHRLSALLGPTLRDELLAKGELVPFVVHGVAWLGEVIVRAHGGRWRFRNPLWESFVHLASAAGEADLALFSWFLRALTPPDSGLGASTLADRYRRFVERPTLDVAALPVFVRGERKLPRLAKVRYDLLHKYLRAHLPELSDLGADFPSPERFEAYGFRYLDVAVVGAGRMVLMSGLAEGGLGAFWLGASGFEGALFIPCDTFPEPRAEVLGDAEPDLRTQRIRLHFAQNKQPLFEELLWWGP